jgi:hypothetical protein
MKVKSPGRDLYKVGFNEPQAQVAVALGAPVERESVLFGAVARSATAT